MKNHQFHFLNNTAMGFLLVFQFAFVLWYEYCLVSFQSFLFTNYIIWRLHPSKIPIILPAMLKSWVHVAVLVKFNSIH